MRPRLDILVFTLLTFVSSFQLVGQSSFIDFSRSNYLRFDKHVTQKGFYLNESFKPFLSSRVDLNIDSLNNCNTVKGQAKFKDKLKREDLVWIEKENFTLRINPLFNFGLTVDLADTTGRSDSLNFYQNTRGMEVRADILNKVHIYTAFWENQSFLPNYQNDFVQQYNVIPGQGRIKPFKNGGYDFAMSNAYVSYDVNKNLNLKFGHGKNFVGNGYRSFLLSDNAFNYPHLSINSIFLDGTVNYVNTYASLQSLERIPAHTTVEAPFIKKQGTFHYLNMHLGESLQLGFFEGVIWQRWDTTGTLKFKPQSIIPVIGLNSILFRPKSGANVVYGLNLFFKVNKTINLYAQMSVDDVS
ncbi:MAG: hypothetical protein MRY83_03015, partial [Flavobacteriales bacterium]|nr:hypothetical protein [Flavobacteriales bacterium]